MEKGKVELCEQSHFTLNAVLWVARASGEADTSWN
jgi:hypothetical protein